MVALLVCLIGINVSFIEKTPYVKGANKSHDGTYEVVTTCVPNSEVFLESVSLLKEGTPIWIREFPGGNHYLVSNTGNVVSFTRVGMNAILEFLDRTGATKTTVKIPFSHGGKFTENGEFLFFLSGSGGLHMFDSKGTQINNFGICHKYAFSADGNIVACVRGDHVELYKVGAMEWTNPLPSPHVRSLAMSQDGEVLSLIDNRFLCVYDLLEKKEIFREEVPSPIVLAISPDGNLNAVAKQIRDITSRVDVVLFNLEQETIWQWSNTFGRENETVHRIDFTDDNELHIYSTDDLHRFSIK